jgi:hypothetical protein
MVLEVFWTCGEAAHQGRGRVVEQSSTQGWEVKTGKRNGLGSHLFFKGMVPMT